MMGLDGDIRFRHIATLRCAANMGRCRRISNIEAVPINLTDVRASSLASGPDLKPRSTRLLFRIWKEQLLAVDLVAGDHSLAFPGDQPIDEGLTEFLLHGRKFFRVHQHDA